MKAILCRELTGPSGLTLEEIPSPTLGTGQVRVAVRACGINFADSLITAGQYQVKPELPFSPGFEVAGDVLELGSDVANIEIGARVIGIPGQGGYAEEVVVDASRIVPLPQAMPYTHGAAFPVIYGTSHVALHYRARLQPGEVLVVHGAAGGVGLTAVEIGKRLGATVIATASTAEKLDVARNHGADHLINATHEDIRTRVKELTKGLGADVIYDPVGGDVFAASLRSINFQGRIVVIGFASGAIPQIRAESLRTLLAWYTEGSVRPHVSETYSLERALEGLNRVVQRKSTGKIVITMGRG